jgi:hypothetical protein
MGAEFINPGSSVDLGSLTRHIPPARGGGHQRQGSPDANSQSKLAMVAEVLRIAVQRVQFFARDFKYARSGFALFCCTGVSTCVFCTPNTGKTPALHRNHVVQHVFHKRR